MPELIAAIALVFLLPIGAAVAVVGLLFWISGRTRKHDDFTGDQEISNEQD